MVYILKVVINFYRSYLCVFNWIVLFYKILCYDFLTICMQLYLWDIALILCEVYFNLSWICEHLHIIINFYVDIWLVCIFEVHWEYMLWFLSILF